MKKLFGGNQASGPTAEQLKAQKEAKELRKREEARKAELEAKQEKQEQARLRGLRGFASLLGGGFTGFPNEKKDELA